MSDHDENDDKFETLLREAVSSPRPSLRSPGTLIAERYRLESHLGQGGMGSVWSATDCDTDQKVALKFMIGHREQWCELKARFRREALAARAVQHPGVVPAREILETDDDALVMVMDLLEGEPLADRLERKSPLSPGETAAILIPVCEATQAAHAVGVLHRDLKPDNIFVENSGVVRVLDFGLARVNAELGGAEEGAALETMPGTVMGTPAYMAPEQAVGLEIDHRADIWTIGTVLFECLVGERANPAVTVSDTVFFIFGVGLGMERLDSAGVPDDLADLIRRMLVVPGEQRLDDLETAIAALRRHAR